MNNKYRLLAILITCLASSACTTTTPLNRELIHQEKIQTINLNQLNSNISIELSGAGSSAAGNLAATGTGGAIGGGLGALIGGAIDASTNAKRRKAIAPLQEKISDFDVNKVLKNALEHNMLDSNAFNESVTINTEYDKSIKKPYLTPILTSSIIMSANYSTVNILLSTSTAQKSASEKQNQYRSVYSSQQAIDHGTGKKADNQQYWIDNPLVLKEKIINGLYDVAKQFSDDFNTIPIEK